MISLEINRLIRLATFVMVFFCAYQVSGQDEEKPAIPLDHFYAKPDNVSSLRLLLSKLHFGLSTGYGRTFYKQDLGGYSILQQQDSTPLLFSNDVDPTTGNIPRGYRYWFNTVEQSDNVTVDPNNDFLVSSDTSELIFRAPGTSIPLQLTLHVEIQNRYKIGAGFMFEYHRVGEFTSKNFDGSIASITPNFGSTFYKKYFLILGGKVYRYYDYVLSVDANIGAFNLSNKFNKGLIQKGVFFNVGATIERELSEYFSAFVRPSFDFKNFTINVPESSTSITTNMNAFYLGVGVFYRIPELKKCFLKNCTTQVNHQHGNKQYRSRMHPIWRKQNPHHGENYPRLFKYKKKNKKKLHPY
ncbi:MAG: hypothetical protein RLO81_17030 [Fulvivirga sp.]|uniref:hypothetical protein n=1 Tax=Fulvivirga sp. TaxID=1931237 RepID=UPI0032EF5B03